MGGRMSKEKGKRGEREVAALLREYGFGARRGQQFSGGDDSPDVKHTMDGFHIEVKRTERFYLYPALEQAQEDKRPHEVPLVFHRTNRGEWVIVMPARDFLKIAREELFE